MKIKEEKRKEAAVRKKIYDQLTIQEKIDKLDKIFGVGIGATKQRSKLIKHKR